MLTWQEVYPVVTVWLQALGAVPHHNAREALSTLVSALLLGQSLRTTALMRALLSPSPVPARQRYKRVARAWTRPWLTSGWLTPYLVRAVLSLVRRDPAAWGTEGLVVVALDSVRCGRWEVYTLAVVWHGRALPVAWEVLRYPLPRGAFGPTIQRLVRLVRRVAVAWPGGPRPLLVADRAFPSRALFGLLERLGWQWVVRVRATDGLLVAGEHRTVRHLLAAARLERWQTWPAAFGSGAGAVPGRLVVGRGLLVVPIHQAGPASLRWRSQQWQRRQQHLATKKRGGPRQNLQASDAWVALFTSLEGPRPAIASYARRWGIEGSYRDAQGGWDGQHGWDLEATLIRTRDSAVVERIVGLWALGALLQSWLGHCASLGEAPPEVAAVVREWTTTGRLSLWGHGRLALTDQGGLLHSWVVAALREGARRVTAAPPCPEAALLTLPQRPGRKAA